MSLHNPYEPPHAHSTSDEDHELDAIAARITDDAEPQESIVRIARRMRLWQALLGAIVFIVAAYWICLFVEWRFDLAGNSTEKLPQPFENRLEGIMLFLWCGSLVWIFIQLLVSLYAIALLRMSGRTRRLRRFCHSLGWLSIAGAVHVAIMVLHQVVLVIDVWIPNLQL